MAIIDAEPRGAQAVLDAICARLSGEIILSGKVLQKDLKYTSSAFDVGQIRLDCGSQQAVLHVMNEYMAVECSGDRLATYPDVITTFTADGSPISAGRTTRRSPPSAIRSPSTSECSRTARAASRRSVQIIR